MIQGKETVGSLSEFDSYSLCVVILINFSTAAVHITVPPTLC